MERVDGRTFAGSGLRVRGACGGLLCLLVFTASAASPLFGQGAAESESAANEDLRSAKPALEFSFEAKAHYRQSDSNRFPVRFPFTPDMLPVGQTQGFEETVDAGSHFEISTATVLVDATWSEHLVAHAKIDFLDLYERNPTSSADEVDLDEIWIRLGRDSQPAALPAPGFGGYLKVGKFPKFERQNDRHLESYGLASTAFNRIEDVGLEVGLDLGRHLYLKGSLTQGNPVFLRDPNALAGDNGTPSLQKKNPNPKIKSGIVIPYDAATQGLDTDGNLQVGAAVGVRFASEAGDLGVDLLAFGRERDLADTVDFRGSFYGADLDLLDGPFGKPLERFAVTSKRKREVGANLWLYLGNFSLFAQYVDQDLGGLPRVGYEAEVAWRFDLPLAAAVGGRQLFPSIEPVVRYSKLDPDYRAPAQTPSPSFAWEWEKLDLGVRFGIVEGVDVTAEYAKNDFILGSGAQRENDELLATVRWRF